jgi:tetratricopeptide (TPR) repeat protein
MAYHKSIGQWEHYYETWMHLVNTYTFMGKVNTALHEVKQMHDDATQRHNNYGLALSNYAMGNAYNNMGYLPEAVKCYQLSIQFIRQTNTSETTYNDIYSYYCDALNENHQWKEMKEVTDDWRKLLESVFNLVRQDGSRAQAGPGAELEAAEASNVPPPRYRSTSSILSQRPPARSAGTSAW